jgi:hypothetical protein
MEKIDINGWRIGPFMESQYRQVLRSVLKDQKQWESFKRHQLLMSVWGQPTLNQFFGMYNELRSVPEVFLKLPEMVKMDRVGGAWGYPLENVFYSRNLIRYADSLRYMSKYFQSLDELSVVEFGSGYGGLAYCAHCLWKPASWHVVDLQEAQDVAVKHCGELGVKIAPASSGEVPDLFIAEFSLTEFVGQKLWDLTDTYIMSAPKVFIRCNIVDDGLRAEWVNKLREEFNLTLLREAPEAVRFNSIIIGTKD